MIGWWMCLCVGAATWNGRGAVSALPADSVKICQLLSKVRQQPATANVPLFFARQFPGAPYVAYTLEKFSSWSGIHYFTEWITANTAKGIVKEIQAPNPPFKAVQTVKVDYMSTHPNSYKALREHPEYLSDIRRMEQKVSGGKFRYIPKGLVSNSALPKKAVRDGDIIAITCTRKDSILPT